MAFQRRDAARNGDFSNSALEEAPLSDVLQPLWKANAFKVVTTVKHPLSDLLEPAALSELHASQLRAAVKGVVSQHPQCRREHHLL